MEKEKNLSKVHKASSISVNSCKRIGIVTSEWNSEITESLKEACLETLYDNGVKRKRITCISVPGSFELAYAAQKMIQEKSLDAVICLGCIIQGETRHFEFIAQACAHGIMKVSIDTNTPVIFGVLTTQTMEQAKDRAGGAHGNKGIESAYTCLKILSI